MEKSKSKEFREKYKLKEEEEKEQNKSKEFKDNYSENSKLIINTLKTR